MKRSTIWLFTGAMLIFLAGCGAERNEEHSARSVVHIGTEQEQEPSHEEMPLLQESMQPARDALRPATSEDETFLNTLQQLEEDILQALVPEAETKALGGEAVDFDELKPDLLRYMTEDMLGMWEHVYDKYPGWIMEPAGLVYTWAMFQPSFRVERQSEGRASATFKVNGDNHMFDGAKLVTYGLLYCDENEAWRIHSLKEEPLLYAFTLEEVTAIMDRIGEDVDYTGEDSDYYYFKPEDKAATYTYKFHKKDGYYDIG